MIFVGNPRGDRDRDRDRGEQNYGRDRDREQRGGGYRRGPRSRVTSDASDTGSNSGNNNKLPTAARGPRSPK